MQSTVLSKGKIERFFRRVRADFLPLLGPQERASLARTVSVNGRLYETDAALAGQKVVLLQDPAAPPERPLLVLHEHREAGRATLLDLHANARVRRHPPPAEDEPTAGTGPDTPANQPPALAGQPPAEQLALRELQPEENDCCTASTSA